MACAWPHAPRAGGGPCPTRGPGERQWRALHGGLGGGRGSTQRQRAAACGSPVTSRRRASAMLCAKEGGGVPRLPWEELSATCRCTGAGEERATLGCVRWHLCPRRGTRTLGRGRGRRGAWKQGFGGPCSVGPSRWTHARVTTALNHCPAPRLQAVRM